MAYNVYHEYSSTFLILSLSLNRMRLEYGLLNSFSLSFTVYIPFLVLKIKINPIQIENCLIIMGVLFTVTQHLQKYKSNGYIIAFTEKRTHIF